jgi:8-oxo-dGTP diphosphatase
MAPPPDDLDRMDEAYRVRLLDAIDSSAPHVRTHDGVQLIAPRP